VEQTYFRWRKEYGGLQVDQAKRLKELEQENAKLKRLVAELSLDKHEGTDRHGRRIFVQDERTDGHLVWKSS